MPATFVITLREGFEAALLLGIVYAYLEKIGRREHYRHVTLGALLGGVASALTGLAVATLSGPLLDLGPDVIGVGAMFLAVAVLTWHGWWMRRHASAVKGDVERQIDAAEASRRLWLVGVIAFLGVFREGAETVLFVWGLLVGASGTAGWPALVGGAAGLAAAALLGWSVFRAGRRVSVRRFFAITSVVILLLAAGLFSSGLGKLTGLGWLPDTPVAWDTSGLLPDTGAVGSFLGGLIGYRDRPRLLEVAGYAAYLLGAGVLVVGAARRPSAKARAVPA